MEYRFQQLQARQSLSFRDNNQPPVRQAYVNPMKRLVVVSLVCLICFSIRTIILPLTYYISNGKFEWPTILIYVICSEILPLFLMLQVFDPLSGPSANEEQGQNITMYGYSNMSQISVVPNNLNPGEHSVSKEYFQSSGSQRRSSVQYEEEDFDPATLTESSSFTTINPLTSPMNTPKKKLKKTTPSSHRFSTPGKQQQQKPLHSSPLSKLAKPDILTIGSLNQGPDIVIDDSIDTNSTSYQNLSVPLLRDHPSTFTNDVLHVIEK